MSGSKLANSDSGPSSLRIDKEYAFRFIITSDGKSLRLSMIGHREVFCDQQEGRC